MNLTFNLTNLTLSSAQPGIQYMDPVAVCASYNHTVETWALLLLILSFTAILWFGPRRWIARLIPNEIIQQAIGTALLVLIGVLAALLQANISR